MVVFNCNACGEALKKNQVEKHTLRCRHCEALSCVDCGKDFWGNDYQTHIKCITEDEKYCGKSYVPKVNKGEVKQEQWTEKVQNAIEKSMSNPKLKGLLERLKDYPNIPRKKAKFENFIKNSLRVNSDSLINQVWDTLMAAAERDNGKQNGHCKPDKTVNKPVSHKLPADDVQENGDIEETDKKKKRADKNNTVVKTERKQGKKEKLSKREEETTLGSAVSHKLPETKVQEISDPGLLGESSAGEHKMSKKERKEERRKKAYKKEKKDTNENSCSTEKNRKGKKRKFSESEEAVHEETEGIAAEHSEKKKKKDQLSESNEDNDVLEKSNNSESRTPSDDETNGENEETSAPKKKKSKKVKFNWEATILAVLQSKGELSLKKLQKKVLSEFAAQDAANYAEDNLRAKLDKKIKKMAKVKVYKDRVKLK